jgi:CO dehydrogenase nickel-insertion accessory protein CooC1
LVNIKTGKAPAKCDILPWLHKNPLKQKDFLVLITDPREKSIELRATIKSLSTELDATIHGRMIIINADSPLENRKYVATYC